MITGCSAAGMPSVVSTDSLGDRTGGLLILGNSSSSALSHCLLSVIITVVCSVHESDSAVLFV